MKQTFVVLIVIISLVGCAFWSPWANWNYDWRQLLGIEPQPELATLKVSSIYGELEIYIDGERRGLVGADSGVLELVDIEPGLREVRIERPTEEDVVNYQYSELLNFTAEVDTVIAYELGPDEKFSEGHTITATPSFLNETSTSLTIETIPENVTVSFDNQRIGNTPLENYIVQPDDVSSIVLSKAGYETMTINIFPETEEDRQRLLGYDILLQANLFFLPIDTDII